MDNLSQHHLFQIYLLPTDVPCHICYKARVDICVDLFLGFQFCSAGLFIFLCTKSNAYLIILLHKGTLSTSFFGSVLAISLLHTNFRYRFHRNQTKTVDFDWNCTESLISKKFETSLSFRYWFLV